MLRQELLPPEILATGFKLPEPYFEVWEMGLIRPHPWWFLSVGTISCIYGGFREQYPSHIYLPFARDGRDDDIACFVIQSARHGTGQVVIVHDTRPEGFEVDRAFEGFVDWFSVAVEDMLERLRSDRPPDLHVWTRQ